MATRITDTTRTPPIDQDDIIARAQRNPRLFGNVYEKYFRQVYHYCLFRVSRRSDVAEDLAQETFLHAFVRLPSFQLRGYSYLTYLLRIAHNLLSNHYRRKETLPIEFVTEIPAESIEPIDGRLISQTVHQALSSLASPEREALLMHYGADMSMRQIGATLGKSENAVKLMVSRVRRKLATHPLLTDLRGLKGQGNPWSGLGVGLSRVGNA